MLIVIVTVVLGFFFSNQFIFWLQTRELLGARVVCVSLAAVTYATLKSR